MRKESRLGHGSALRAEASAQDGDISRPTPGKLSSDASIEQTFKAAQRASNDVARARVSGQEGVGVQEWQSYETPLRPVNTPNMQQAARSERAIAQGHNLQSHGPTDTPRWVQTTTDPPAQQARQAGQDLAAAGVQNDNTPLSPEAKVQMEYALDRYRKIEQKVGESSRLDAAARERVQTPSTPSKSVEKETRHR